MIFWKNRTFCIDISLVLGKGTQLSKPFLRSRTPLSRQWIKGWLRVVFSYIFLRHLIQLTIIFSFLNSTIMAYVEYPSTGLKSIFTIALSLLRLVPANLMLKPLLVEYHRDQLWVLYYSYFISMIYLTAQKNYPFVYLLMIQLNIFFASDNLIHLESTMNEEFNSVFKYCNINKLSINFY